MEAGLPEAQLAAAVSAMQLQERRKCEYYSCTNYTALQKEGEKLLVCSGCKSKGVVTVYCTAECQKGHWKAHQLRCKTVITTKKTIIDNPPPLGEHITSVPVISESDLLGLLSKFTGSLPTQKEDDDDDDEDEDEDDDDEDEEDEEEDQDVDSMGRALPQNRKKRRPMNSSGGPQDESEDGEKEKEKVDPFLPFGPISEGTNYWSFSGPAEQTVELSPNSKSAVPLKLASKKKRTPARKPGEEETKPAEELSSLSFSFTPSSATEETKSSTESSSSAPVFTFGGDSATAVPSFTPGVTTELPSSLPETFQFGK